ISRRVDWQGQASLFLPSYTADPLLQIYLGSRTVVQEISATLLQQTSRESHEAFRRLWKEAISPARPPTVVVVLKASALQTSSPGRHPPAGAARARKDQPAVGAARRPHPHPPVHQQHGPGARLLRVRALPAQKPSAPGARRRNRCPGRPLGGATGQREDRAAG